MFFYPSFATGRLEFHPQPLLPFSRIEKDQSVMTGDTWNFFGGDSQAFPSGGLEWKHAPVRFR